MRRILAALALTLLLPLAAQAASTVDPTIPAQNSAISSAPIRNNFAAAATDITNIETMFAGASAPINPSVGQLWRNTTGTSQPIRQWDAAQWVLWGTLDTVAHTFVSAASTLVVGTTVITGGATTRVLYDNAGVLGEYTISGTGTVVAMQTSPSFTTPALGVATGTSLALGGATIGANALAVTGAVLFNTPLPLASGGTNAALTASVGGLAYSTGSALAILPGTATANQIPLSGSSAAPAWSTATYPPTTTINQLLYSSAANVVGGLATANNGVLVTSAGGVPTISSTIPSATQDNITRLGTIVSGVWQGSVIALAYGGTNAALTASLGGVAYSTASALALLAGTATASLPLLSGASAAPTWATVSHPTSATSGGVAFFSSTTVMASSGLLTQYGLVYGGGAGAAPVATAAGVSGQVPTGVTGAAPAWSATPTLGASGTIGTLALGNATSGTVTLGTVAGALGSVTASLPANTGTIAELNLAQSWTATQTFQTLLAGTTNTYDVGTSATVAAFRTVYAGTSFVGPVGTFTTSAATPTITLGTQQTVQGSLVMANTAAGAFSTTVKSSNSASAAYTMTLPTTGGTTGYALTTSDGAGTLQWSNIGTGPFLPVAGGTMTGGVGFSTTNTLDIGTSATVLAPRTVYAGTSFSGPAGVFTTSATTPLLIGGAGTTGTQLTLQTTTGTGTTDAFALKGGTNGGTTFATLASAGFQITSAGSAALAVGRQGGSTGPAFSVDASAGSQTAGLKVTGAALNGTVGVVVTDTSGNTGLTINALGSGTIGIGSVSTGAVTITPALTLSAALTYGGVTLSNAVTGTGNMMLSASPTTTGTMTAAAANFSGTITFGTGTITGLTNKASPDSSNDYLVIYDNAGTAIKKATVGAVSSAGASGVTSLGGLTGVVGVQNGIETSGNNIQVTAARRTLPTTTPLTSGTGATYTTPANCIWIEVHIIGAGGGGAGVVSSSLTYVAGTAGSNVTFNNGATGFAMITAAGGGGAVATSNGGGGGDGGTSAASGTTQERLRFKGNPGGNGLGSGATLASASGFGASSHFGGGVAGVFGGTNSAGTNAAANTGAGGSGGYDRTSTFFTQGGGGASGEYVYLIINSPAATYTYTIGAGGGGGSNTYSGGNGGSGYILIIEHYGS